MISKSYIQNEPTGVMSVGTAKVPIDSIVAGFEIGDSPETIQRQYPALSLEEIYGAITYYLANRAEVIAYLKKRDALWDSWRSKAERNPDPLIERMRAASRQRQAS